ncbi:MAG: hypothetical protein IKY18_03650 [Oscillospiraceae bacterium]|nr:hypothetical protein [Oscillospiraceae bacterium]
MARVTDFRSSYRSYISGLQKEAMKGKRTTVIDYEDYRTAYETQARLNRVTYARRWNPETGHYESTGKTLAKESIVKQLIRQSIDVPVRRAQEARKTILERQLEEQGLTGEDRPSAAKIRKMIEAGELDVPSLEDLKGMSRAEAFMLLIPEDATREDYAVAEEIFYPEKADRRGMPKSQQKADRKAKRAALEEIAKKRGG